MKIRKLPGHDGWHINAHTGDERILLDFLMDLLERSDVTKTWGNYDSASGKRLREPCPPKQGSEEEITAHSPALFSGRLLNLMKKPQLKKVEVQELKNLIYERETGKVS